MSWEYDDDPYTAALARQADDAPPLAAARGCLIGLALSVPFWLIAALTLYVRLFG